jgi:hypothetical protein
MNNLPMIAKSRGRKNTRRAACNPKPRTKDF